MKLAIHHPQQELVLHNGMVWKVGCGERFKFWEDRWIDGETALIAKYPRLYLNSCQQNHFIQQMGVLKDIGWEWDFKWRRLLFDSEIPMVDSFLKDVGGIRIQPRSRDEWVWKQDPTGQYTVKSAYLALRGNVIEGDDTADFEVLWKLRIPSKAAVFVWRLLRDRLPTKLNLRRRNVEINDLHCPFCRRSEEDAAHLFFHCSRITPIWGEALSWVNMLSVFPQHPRQNFSQHMIDWVDGIRGNRWRVWWVAFTWNVWQLRNKIIFSNGTFDGNKLLEDALFLLWSWLRSFEKDFTIHYNQWSSNLRDAFVLS